MNLIVHTILSADAILNASDLPTETVPVPEWKGSVMITTMPGTDRDAWEASITNAQGKVTAENIRAKLVVRVAVDVDGKRIFTDDQAEQLGKKSAKVLSRLYNVAARLNGLTKEDIEELAKN